MMLRPGMVVNPSPFGSKPAPAPAAAEGRSKRRMSRYFIDRPIFAWVLAIIVMMAGIIAIRSLPIAQFPAIAPPAVSITATYPGADAETLERTTTQVIEQQLKGIDHLRYFSSSSSSAGQATITVTFEQGTDPDIAQVQVQNKLQAATPLLPQEVQRQGLTRRQGDAELPAGHRRFIRRTARMTASILPTLIVSKLQDPLSRVARRRRHASVRLAICHAHLGRSREAAGVPADAARRDRGDPGAECAGFGGPDRRIAGTQGADAQRHGFGAVAPVDAAAIRSDRPEELDATARPCG